MRHARGYTVPEVLISLAMLTIGVMGVIAMQKVTIIANRDARNLVVANQIGRGWLDRLRTDAVAWNHPSVGDSTSDLSDTVWLNHVDNTWFRPADHARGAGAADAFGNDVSYSAEATADFANRAVFCTHVRLNWVSRDTTIGPLVLRADVRVFWLRDGGGGNLGGETFCAPSMNAASVADATVNYHFVYLTTAVVENAQ